MKISKANLRKFFKNKVDAQVGLGDTVKDAIDKVTFGLIKPCSGCLGRQKLLNELIEYAETKEKDNSSGD